MAFTVFKFLFLKERRVAIDARCDVEVGHHESPYWISGNLEACNRHKQQYEERADEFGPFDWQPQED